MTNVSDAQPVLFILHENPEWIPPLAAALDAEGVPFREWLVTSGSIDLTQEPPAGIFWSRLSASAHTRGNPHAKEYARAILRWLEAAGRTVINGSDVVELEVSKVAQYLALRRAEFDVPHTIAVFGGEDAVARSKELVAPFITKHNQGGKGLGVQRFDSHEEFERQFRSGAIDAPNDGILLLQEYLTAAEPFITRAEFVGGEFVYAVRVDTSAGSFELCPADACVVPGPGQGLAPAACDVPSPDAGEGSVPVPFARRPEVGEDHPLIAKLAVFLTAQHIDVAGVEFIETNDGRLVPYDINTNTNYNPAVESDGGVSAARALARYLGAVLQAEFAVT